MTVHRAWYVTCDVCGNAIGGTDAISTESAAHARRLAKQAGANRRKVLGRLADLCQVCKPPKA